MRDERDLLSAIRRTRQRLAIVGPSHTRTEGDFERVTLPSDHCDLLRGLVIAEDARVVIEIGLAYGSSALAIAEALVRQEDPRHLIIDAFHTISRTVGGRQSRKRVWTACALCWLSDLSWLFLVW